MPGPFASRSLFCLEGPILFAIAALIDLFVLDLEIPDAPGRRDFLDPSSGRQGGHNRRYGRGSFACHCYRQGRG